MTRPDTLLFCHHKTDKNKLPLNIPLSQIKKQWR